METEELIIFDVHSAGNKFAQDCPICLQPIVYMASVCYCQCNINFHPKCVKQMLNGKQLTHQPRIQCLYCRSNIGVTYEVDIQLHFMRQNCNIGNSLYIMALLLFVGTLCSSVVVITEYQMMEGKADVKTAVACMVLLVSFVGIGFATFKVFMLFFTKKIVTVDNVKTVERSLEFSAFKNMNCDDQETDHRIIVI